MGELSVPKIPPGEGVGGEPGDTCDLSASALERTLSVLLRERGYGKLRAIEHAIERVKEGTFGICEVCGGKIPLGRLKVMPFATTCVLCKSMQEKREKLFSAWKDGLFSDDIDMHEFSGQEQE
jgi:DnaK suppressor protein